MAVNPSRTKMAFDVHASTLLRSPAATQLTATFSDVGISLKELRTAYWHNFEIPHGVMRVGVVVSVIDRTTGDETYVLSLQVDDNLAFSSPTTIASFPSLTIVGYYEFDVDSKSIPFLDPVHGGTDKFMRTTATLGGTTPILSYGAWIGKSTDA